MAAKQESEYTPKTPNKYHDPCELIKQQLEAAVNEKIRIQWSGPVTYVMSTNSFVFSAKVPPILDELIDYLREQIREYETSITKYRRSVQETERNP